MLVMAALMKYFIYLSQIKLSVNMDKTRVLNLLKPRIKSKGFGKETVEGLADLISKNLKDDASDEDVNNAISGVLPYTELMQSENNRYATIIEDKYKNNPPSNPPATPPANDPTLLNGEAVQKMIDDALAPYKQREEADRLQKALFLHDKVKNIPDVFRSKYSVSKDEDIETVAAQIETDFSQMKQDLIKTGEFAEPPATGNSFGTSDDFISALQGMPNPNTK